MLVLFVVFKSVNLFSATKTANTTGNWNVMATWSGAAAPISGGGDDLIINSGVTVTLTGDYSTTGAVTIIGTGTLELNGYNLTIGSLTATGAAVINNSGVSKTLTIGNGSTSSYTGIIAGIIAVIKTGAGSLTLSGANTFSEGLTLSAGTLNINSQSAIGTGIFTISGGVIDNTSSGSITLSTDNLMNFNADFTFTGTQNLNLGYGTITLSASRTITTTAKELILNGGIDHSGYNLTKAGNGSLTLTKQTVTLNNLTISAGIFNAGSSLIRLFGALSNSGTFNTGTGTVSFSGSSAQNIPAFTFNILSINNTSGVTLTGAVVVSTGLILNNGKIVTSSTNTLTLQSTASIAGGSTLSYIDGPLKRVLPANLSSSSNLYVFPVGKSTGADKYYPFYLSSVSSGATGPTMTVEAFAAATGGTYDGTLGSISTTEYWLASFTGNYTTGSVSLGRQTALGTLTSVGRCATINGIYSSLQGTASGLTIIYSSVTGSTLNYFVMGARNNYYSKSTGNLDVLSNWGPNTDGSGTAPASFALNNTVWNVRNNGTPTLGGNWALSGTGSYIIVGDGSVACNFTIPSGQSSVLPTTNVSNNASLTIQTTAIPLLGTLSNGSTVNYASGSSQNVSSANYYNLNLTGGNRVLSTSGSIGVAGTFTIGAGTITTFGSTVVFNSTGDQVMPIITGGYYNLQSQLGGVKTFANNVTINGVITVGNISKIDLQTNVLTFARDASETKTGFDRIKATGTFLPNGSTVVYSVAGDTVSSVNYYNLNLTGSGKFATSDLIGISGTLSGTSASWTKTGSTVVFNGTTAQNMPTTAFTFGNLKISNTSGVTLQNNVTVSGTLNLYAGVLFTCSSYSVAVTNTDVNAVIGGGTSTYVDGKLTRSLSANLSSSANSFLFPVGNYVAAAHHYLPFVLSSSTTGATAPTYTVQAYYASTGGSAGGSGATQLTSISSSEYWQTSYTGNFTSTKITLTRPTTLSGVNAIGYSSTIAGAYISEHGTVNGSYSVINSDVVVTATGIADFYVLGTRATSAATYYYTATGAGCASPALNNTACWWTNSGGTGSNPSNFSSNDITYYVKASATLSSYDWNVTGYNSSVYVGDGSGSPVLTISSGHSISTTGDLMFSCNSTLNILSSASLTVAGNLSMPTSLSCGSGTPITVNNYGTMNVAQGLTQMGYNSFSTINNFSTGIINLTGDYSTQANMNFKNYGVFNVNNGNFTINQNSNGWSFTNGNNGVVNVDNTLATGKVVSFGTASSSLNYSNDINLQTGSRFNIVKSDVVINGYGTFTLAGTVYVQDANVYLNSGAGFTITTPGGMYLLDTDNSGDGILYFGASGGLSLTDNGTLYVEGIIPPSGGGNAITVASGANMFIGNIGLYTGSNSNYLTVSNGGVLNFCGNKTSGADNVGSINTGGTLNYALGYYTSETPGAQSDFSVSGSQVAAFADAASCLATFENNISNILPISLEYFDVKLNGEIVALEWKTATETNNDFFTIMKSYDASTYEILGTVNGAGTTTISHYYTFNDVEPQNGVNYYKIKQTDFDGASTFSPVRSIKYKKKNVFIQVYPIPGKSENITLNLWSEKNEIVTLMISAVYGQVYSSGQIEVSNNRLEIPLSNFAKFVPGKYIVTVFSKLFVDNVDIIVE